MTEGTHDNLEMIALSDVIVENGKLDLLHIDIQGGEAELVRDSIETCNSSVRYIVIGTHSRFIEGTLEKLMFDNDWELEVDRPAISSLENGVQTLRFLYLKIKIFTCGDAYPREIVFSTSSFIIITPLFSPFGVIILLLFIARSNIKKILILMKN